MGRFDGPQFFVEREDVVSVWAAASLRDKAREEYFDENYSDEDEEPFNQFSSDFGFGFYDHDFVELIEAKDRDTNAVGDLLAASSYATSFAGEAERRAGVLGISEASCVFLMYNFKYEPATTGVFESPTMRFIGVFPFSRVLPTKSLERTRER